MIPIRRLVPALLLLPIAALGCKKAEAPAPPVGEAAAPAMAPLTVTAFDLGKAIDSNQRIATPTTTFGVRDTIYVSISTTGTSAGATLATRWTYEGGQVVHEDSRTIVPTGPAVTEFHIMNADPWPKGSYQVEVLLDGVSAGTRDFAVQ